MTCHTVATIDAVFRHAPEPAAEGPVAACTGEPAQPPSGPPCSHRRWSAAILRFSHENPTAPPRAAPTGITQAIPTDVNAVTIPPTTAPASPPTRSPLNGS